MSILDVTGLTHTFSEKRLFNNADMHLYRGDKMGLTGLNGAGKSTFISILVGEMVADFGTVKWNPKVRLGYLDQKAAISDKISIQNYLKKAYDWLFKIEDELNELNRRISGTSDPDQLAVLCRQAGSRQQLLENNNIYAIDSQVDKVAAGLGITAIGIEKKVSILSGGQRAKVMLARLLLETPDILLLDEPTNFLDKEHIQWLAKYLNSFKGSFILVSHDFAFLDRVVNCICDIEFGVFNRYTGGYESFKKQKEGKRLEYMKNYNAQQKEIEKLEDYIHRNSARASTAKMAQSRQKKLDRIDRLDKPSDTTLPTFLFTHTPPGAKNLMVVKELSIGYGGALIPSITMVLEHGKKLAVTGFNGIGKTTFLKTVCGLIPPLSGSVKLADKIKIGYYEQESAWEDVTSIAELKNNFPQLTEKEIRSSLSRCGLKREQMMQKLPTLSGGEQAKVKLCKLMLVPCNLLLLDEPTSHLDVNAIDQLKVAIKEFKGGVIFVSHSKEFIQETADSCLDLEKLFD